MSPAPSAQTPRGWWWLAPVGFAAAFGLTIIVSTMLAGLLAVVGVSVTRSPGFALASTVIQDAALVVVAVYLARRIGRDAAPWLQFRRLPARTLLLSTFAAAMAFYVVVGLYAALVTQSGEQDTLETLGADRSVVWLVAAAVLVIWIAPVCEELFFRGFFYGTLRTSLGVAPAALAAGLLFGVIHFTGTDTLPLLPVLAWLGVVLCLVYEKTGSLWPAIGVHIVNNTLALATVGPGDAPLVAGVVGAMALVGWLAFGVSRRRGRSDDPQGHRDVCLATTERPALVPESRPAPHR